ncbi:MAG TPA: DUF1801 domain-containing protein [Terriglobales bacterium]|nr:DUF1801 domain-containing protein [Terriglobales bacterium]
MDRRKAGFKTIDEYIASFPADIRRTLRGLRATIRAAAPGAGEKISYGIPTFTLNGNLVHFAAFEKHISFFPTSSGVRAFRRELAAHDLSKGTIRFPLGRPLPLGLVRRIVRFRVAESTAKPEKKPGARKKRTS